MTKIICALCGQLIVGYDNTPIEIDIYTSRGYEELNKRTHLIDYHNITNIPSQNIIIRSKRYFIKTEYEV